MGMTGNGNSRSTLTEGADMSDMANRADLADWADWTDRADRAYMADSADRADRADMADMADMADRTGKSFVWIQSFCLIWCICWTSLLNGGSKAFKEINIPGLSCV